MSVVGRVHSCETFGAADGPGVRYIVFLHGCGFRCAYCHNPDTWATNNYTERTADEILKTALRYRPYWGGEGGITLSGGEPMLQSAFAAELFERAHAAGVNTCLDTAGGPFDARNNEILRLLHASDLVMLDIKAMDPALHRDVTGADNAPVLACARYLAEKRIRVWLRHVVVPGWTDSEPELTAIRAFADSLGNVEKLEMLPYHTFGVEKWHRLGLKYRLEDVHPK